jgi:hypothetical protein
MLAVKENAMFVEYELEDGTSVLIESAQPEGMIKAGRGVEEAAKAAVSFEQALDTVNKVAKAIKVKLEDARADQVEVSFGLTTTGKLGNFAIAEVGVSANFTVKLTWKNS